MEINQAQETVRKFDFDRGWSESWDIKDLLLNITEEGGEMWNLVKWVDVEKQKQILEKEKREVEDYIGDTLFLLLKIANQTGVDVEKSFNMTMDDYFKRFPAEKMKEIGHGNKYAGGYDGKNGNNENGN
jgi:NTP pyrophosphatase (non-canonical NTP hydrolase)